MVLTQTEVALVIAHETGHRIGAIRQLRWSDIDLEHETIRWRAEHEKTGYEHQTPITAEALAILQEARRRILYRSGFSGQVDGLNIRPPFG